MKLAILFSGGKDSFLAMQKAMKTDEAVCLISIVSENQESYMFHVPNIHLADLQAEALGIPLVKKVTAGEKEKELEDLHTAIQEAKEKYGVEGIVTGAIASTYQGSRVQKICNDLGLWCFNPLWLRDQVSILQELIDNGFKTIIAGVFAYPLDESYLGKVIDRDMIVKLTQLQKDFEMNPAGEGGEIETVVIDSPLHKKKIIIEESSIDYENHSGTFHITKARLEQK